MTTPQSTPRDITARLAEALRDAMVSVYAHAERFHTEMRDYGALKAIHDLFDAEIDEKEALLAEYDAQQVEEA